MSNKFLASTYDMLQDMYSECTPTQSSIPKSSVVKSKKIMSLGDSLPDQIKRNINICKNKNIY